MKRYYIRYEDDKTVCGSNEHTYCNASTLKTAKSIARKVKNDVDNSRNIRVYDIETADENGFALAVFTIE